MTHQVARPYIAHGYKASSGDYSFQGAISIDGGIGCSGSVITENLVLTAAHCLLDKITAKVLHPQQVQFHIGKVVIETEAFNRIKSATYTVAVKELYPHQNFTYEQVINDIGIIVLASNFDFNVTQNKVIQIALYGANVNVTGRLCQEASWGLIDDNNPESLPSSTLREATFRIRKAAICKLHDAIYDHSLMLCAAGALNSNHLQPRAMNGDSGSPLLWPAVKHRRFRKALTAQLGIDSYSGKGVDDRFYSYYTRVSSFIPWIKQYADKYSSHKLYLVYPH